MSPSLQTEQQILTLYKYKFMFLGKLCLNDFAAESDDAK